MVNLFKEYGVEQQEQPPEAKKGGGINLLKEYDPINQPGTDEEALELAKKQISKQYPGMPDWLRDAILKITPKENSPMLDAAAKGVSNVTNLIPAAAGGLLQGASIPIRGVASTIPTEFTQKLANSPDLSNLFQKPEGELQNAVHDTGEFFGALGPLGKMFGALKGATQAAKVPKALQNATALAGTGYLGTQGDEYDKAIGSASALGAGAVGKVASKALGKLGPFARGLFNESTPESLIEAIQKPHDVLEQGAHELYGQVREAIKKRGVKTPISEELIEQVKEHFPKNARSYQELLEKAKQGDYEAIHKIQSSLYKKGTKALSSDDLAIENQGEDILDLREKINETVNDNLIKEGHLDIAHVLSQGKKLYSDLQKTYYDKLLPKAVGKLVHPETRLIPKNLKEVFEQESVPMKRFLKRHPDVSKHAKGLKEKEAAMKALRKLAWGAAGAGAGVAGTRAVIDLFD
jgi:hypothetical protein